MSNIKDVAESVGIANLSDDVAENLARDVEYRISQVLEEALKFMRHAKRSVMTTQDISNALRILDVEPLYGYESTRPLKFGEATMGPGQPLFYVEDEEVDFEKLINAPLPKIPREISFTGMLGHFYDAALFATLADLKRLHSTLARNRERAAQHTTKPNNCGLAQLRTGPQGTKCQPQSCRHERAGTRQREAISEAYPVEGTTAIFRESLLCAS
ncbi:hypothetical protein KEM55_002390 [Ascosphaera atra]|nr:hypothetical protein KEM55_002390 [Ascosphaera atra]